MHLALAALLWSACGPDHAGEPVQLQTAVRAAAPILSVVPAAGYRINGRVPPALELASGEVIRLTRGRRSADADYFVEPPWQVRPPGTPLRGSLRVSLCRTDESLCRTTRIPVDLRD